MNRARLVFFLLMTILLSVATAGERPGGASFPAYARAERGMVDKMVDFYLSAEDSVRKTGREKGRTLKATALGPVIALGESLEEIKIKVETATETIGRLAEAVGRFTAIMGRIAGTIEKWLGFKVVLVLVLTFIIMMGINLSGIAGGRASFAAALLLVSGLWYAWNVSWDPAGGGDLATVARTFGCIAVPYGAIFLIKYFLRVSLALLKKNRSLKSLEAARSHGEALLLSGAAPAGLLERRDLYDFEELSSSLSRLCHEAWAAGRNERDILAADAARLRARLARLLLGGGREKAGTGEDIRREP